MGRFAPTPSGRLHLGNLLCAMLAYLSVRSRNGLFLLRIEDTDIPRCPRKNTEQVLRDLERLGFEWDGEVLLQSERGEIYREALERLEEQGLIYPCFCTRAALHQGMAPNQGDTRYVYPGTCRRLTPAQRDILRLQRSPAIRVHLPEEVIGFDDRLQGRYEENIARETGDMILRRSDGLWAYPLCVVVDDGLSGIT